MKILPVVLFLTCLSNALAGPMPVKTGCATFFDEDSSVEVTCGDTVSRFADIDHIARRMYGEEGDQEALYFVMKGEIISKFGYNTNWLSSGLLKELFKVEPYDHEIHGEMQRKD